MRKIGEVALTQAERNKRFYWNHKQELLAKNAQFYRDNKDTQKIRHRNNRHHITQDWFDQKLKEQGNRCALCKKEFDDTPHIDHNHNCCPPLKSCDKCRRGLLCKNCNLGLGRFFDDVNLLSSAIEYLKGYQNV